MKAYLFKVWDSTLDASVSPTREYLVVAKDEDKAIETLEEKLGDNDDYDLEEEFDYDKVIVSKEET